MLLAACKFKNVCFSFEKVPHIKVQLHISCVYPIQVPLQIAKLLSELIIHQENALVALEFVIEEENKVRNEVSLILFALTSLFCNVCRFIYLAVKNEEVR